MIITEELIKLFADHPFEHFGRYLYNKPKDRHIPSYASYSHGKWHWKEKVRCSSCGRMGIANVSYDPHRQEYGVKCPSWGICGTRTVKAWSSIERTNRYPRFIARGQGYGYTRYKSAEYRRDFHLALHYIPRTECLRYIVVGKYKDNILSSFFGGDMDLTKAKNLLQKAAQESSSHWKLWIKDTSKRYEVPTAESKIGLTAGMVEE